MYQEKLKQISSKLPLSIEWKQGELYFLDQTKLPLEVVIEKQESLEAVYESIQKLKVRGAPAIGCGGAFGLLVGLKDQVHLHTPEFLAEVEKRANYLDSARPTAVNLSWALKRMVKKANEFESLTAKSIYIELEKEAVIIYQEDVDCCLRIGQHGEPLIEEGMGVLTHCNAGHLAVSKLGTALSPMYTSLAKGKKFKVYADETRPLLQGARLTTWELQQAGVDVTLICDNMAASMMASGKINLVIVGTDRVAGNGDVANKIGTLGVAILAKYFNIPFYVACPYSTIDLNTSSGDQIEIEQRSPEEVTSFGEKRTAPEDIQTENPAFDVTPNALVTGIITEKGIFKAPFNQTLTKAGQYE